VPKFELYKHNNELFNIYYRICYELWTFAYFDRLCKLEKRGDEILKNLLWEIPIKIFLSHTICSIRTKCWWNSHWMVLFQKCVRRFGPSIKMAPTAELSLT
jgi:hypothetical protein